MGMVFGDISAVILSCWFSYIWRVGPGILHLSTQGLHSFIVSLSLHRRFALRFILVDPLMENKESLS